MTDKSEFNSMVKKLVQKVESWPAWLSSLKTFEPKELIFEAQMNAEEQEKAICKNEKFAEIAEKYKNGDIEFSVFAINATEIVRNVINPICEPIRMEVSVMRHSNRTYFTTDPRLYENPYLQDSFTIEWDDETGPKIIHGKKKWNDKSSLS